MRWIVAVLLSITSLAAAAEKTTIALNWVPEPEFGGIYAAQVAGHYAKNGLDVDIKPGGAGVPTWQRVARGQVDFAVSSADEVVIARSQGADVVAIFTIYQTCPQGIMVHKDRGLKELADVFKTPGTLALEIGLPYGKFLKEKYGLAAGVKQVPYTGGIANFLADKNFAQQCFVFAEPIMAKAKGAEPQTFLIADSGYNPYTGVIITSGKFAKEKPGVVAMMIQSMDQGWRAYLKDPKPANDVMSQLNKQMDAASFAAGAEAQKPLIEGDKDKGERLGRMKTERWQTLIDQLAGMKLIKESPEAKACFLTEDALMSGSGRK